MMKRVLTLTSALILACAVMAMAAPVPTIELVPNGTSFSVMASNFTKVDGFQMLIQYNPLALQKPQVAAGDMIVGGIFVPNVNHSRSTVNIALTNAFKSIEGSGKLATISFSPVPGGAAKGNVNIPGNGYKFTSNNASKTVTVKLISSGEQSLGKLENDAIVACLNDSLNCTAEVKPDGTVSLNYMAKTPVSGSCGAVSGTIVSTAPAANLCSQGTPSSISGNGPWYWKCSGSNGGTSADCVATKTPDAINGICGGATGSSFPAMPADNLCSAGIASALAESDSWTWSCLGVNGGSPASCSAKKSTSQSNGICGAANGVPTSSRPMLLCAAGIPSDVSESSSLWAWSCFGVNGGAQANCSAPTPASLPTQYAAQTGQTTSIGFVTQSVEQAAPTSDKKADSQPLVTDLRKDMTIPLGGADATTGATKKAPEQDKEAESKFISYKAALQYFTAYKGERNPKSLIALFAESAIPAFIQDPPIALSDGKGVVRIKLSFNASGSELPKFIMQGATLKKLPTQGEDGFWSMEALPKKDAYDAKLTVIDGERMLEFPLTVAPVTAPLLGKDKKFTEADFARFLAKPAKYDLNGDKKFDSIDDFIYTANYIVALKIKPEKLKVDQPKKVEDGKKKEPAKQKDLKAKDEMDKAAPKPAVPVKKATEPAGPK